MFPEQFDADDEFQKLLARRTDVDLLTAALELARDGDADVRFDEVRRWVAGLVDELRAEIVGAESPGEALRILADSLSTRHGLRGHAECHHRADGSYLHRVIATGCGIPISLSVLYLAVGQQLGMPIFGIAAPAHFLIGCETAEGLLILDAYTSGRILSQDAAIDWLAEVSGWPPDAIEGTLRPTSTRAVIIRMLNNLKRIHVCNGDWPAAFRVQQRLAALRPSSYEERRDLAVFALKIGRAGFALNGIERCLSTCPPEDREGLLKYWQTAKSCIAATN